MFVWGGKEFDGSVAAPFFIPAKERTKTHRNDGGVRFWESAKVVVCKGSRCPPSRHPHPRSRSEYSASGSRRDPQGCGTQRAPGGKGGLEGALLHGSPPGQPRFGAAKDRADGPSLAPSDSEVLQPGGWNNPEGPLPSLGVKDGRFRGGPSRWNG